MKNNIIEKDIEWFLAEAIFVLFILFFPFKISAHLPNVIRYFGISLMIIGIGSAIYAAISLKSNLRPAPKPPVGGSLVTTGLYSIVRHPLYSGIVIAALGVSLWETDAVRCLLTAALFIFLDFKSKIEEKWLEKSFSEYIDYKKRVSEKFIPGIY